MEQKQQRTPVKMSVSPWKLTLPGKILAVCLCILPFFTRAITLNLPQSVRNAYFLGDAAYSDFEQLCREWFLLAIAAAAVGWFCYEQITLRPKRKLPLTRIMTVVFLFLGIYLLLGLLSSVTSDYAGQTWMGIYMLYEGYLALVGYAVVFAAAWYWIDRKEVLDFTKTCLTVLAIVLGVLALLEHYGMCYYNNFLVQKLGALPGTVGYGDGVVMTFGNADYFGMYCAMLLPLMTALIAREGTTKRLVAQLIAAVLLAAALLLSHVMNAILIGFGLTLIFLVVWAFHTNWKRAVKGGICGAAAAAVVIGGFGFLWSRSGDTFSEKFRHTMIGAEQEDTFRLLSVDLSENTVALHNADTTLEVSANSSALSPQQLTFTCNGTEIVPQISADGTCTFAEPELQHCQVQVQTDRLDFNLGYATPLETIREADGWVAVGIGKTELKTVPKTCDSEKIQQCYPYLNGRVFVWANTISVLGDCWLLGHGPATTIFYLNQNDLPALLNIFSTYVLYNKPHSWYLQIAQDTGIVSLVMILGILVLFLVCGFRKCFGKQEKWDPFRTGLLFSILAYVLMAFLNDSLIYHVPMFWFLLGIGWRQMTVGITEE